MALLHEQPREKLHRQGIQALRYVELLQLIIGSGNAQSSVSRIAKRTLKVLKDKGSKVSYQDLDGVSGLGPARISQILATFELASRYPVEGGRVLLDTPDAIQGYVRGIGMQGHMIALGLDGGSRLLTQQLITGDDRTSRDTIRKIFSQSMAKDATSIMIAVHKADSDLTPSLDELSLARDIKQLAWMLGFDNAVLILINDDHYYSVTHDVR